MTPAEPSRSQVSRRLTRARGRLSSAALARMEQDMPWVRQLTAEERSWIGLIIQAGIKSFIDWYRHDQAPSRIRHEVFGSAPRTLASEISLEQTVALVRLSIDVVDENLDAVLDPPDAEHIRRALNGYAREVAFATAEVYARAAEQRGAWDARLEALVVDAVLRGTTSLVSDGAEDLTARAATLGWRGGGGALVMAGSLRSDTPVEDVRRLARERRLDCLCAVQGNRLVVVLGGVTDAGRAGEQLADAFGPGPVVVGPVVDGLTGAGRSADAALCGLRVAPAWPQAPRPVLADDLLPERALAGDEAARQRLVALHDDLAASSEVAVATLAAYAESGGSVEGTARALFVHPNTVRYRLRRVADVAGLVPSDPRDAYTLRVALTLGRLAR
ncbi:MAG: PucR family transcriptional regulator [Marmoricola sp.]